MKLGLLGGTFDPVHIAHLRCAEEILETYRLDRILFVPSASPPLKRDPGVTRYRDRENMVKLAIRGNRAFSCSDIENRREGRSYSIDTVRSLLREHGKALELYFIMGQDAFNDIQRWKSWKHLLTLCHFIIMSRPGSRRGSLGSLPPEYASRFVYDRAARAWRGPRGRCIHFTRVSLLDIESTDIRLRVRHGRSIRYLVPEAVREYIGRKELYKDGV